MLVDWDDFRTPQRFPGVDAQELETGWLLGVGLNCEFPFGPHIGGCPDLTEKWCAKFTRSGGDAVRPRPNTCKIPGYDSAGGAACASSL